MTKKPYSHPSDSGVIWGLRSNVSQPHMFYYLLVFNIFKIYLEINLYNNL